MQETNADYDEMGRELLESLGLTGPRGQAEFNDLDPICNANFALDINIKRSFSWGFRLISKKNHRFNFSVFDIYVGKNVKVWKNFFDISRFANIKLWIDINISFSVVSGHFLHAGGHHPHRPHAHCVAMPVVGVGVHRTSGHTQGQVGGIWARPGPLVSPTQRLGSGPAPGQ